jgi:hypothetical protein
MFATPKNSFKGIKALCNNKHFIYCLKWGKICVVKERTAREFYRIIKSSWDFAMDVAGSREPPLTPRASAIKKMLRRLPEPATQKEKWALANFCYELPMLFCEVTGEMVKILSSDFSRGLTPVSLIRESSKKLHMPRSGRPSKLTSEQGKDVYKDWARLTSAEGVEHLSAVTTLASKFNVSPRTIRNALHSVTRNLRLGSKPNSFSPRETRKALQTWARNFASAKGITGHWRVQAILDGKRVTFVNIGRKSLLKTPRGRI